MSFPTYNINQSEYPDFLSAEYPLLKYRQIAFDLDGTIFEDVSDVEKTWREKIDLIPMPGASATFNKIKEWGIEILIYTCRPHYHRRYLEEQFKKNNIPFDLFLFYTKPRADLYVDNKALRFVSMQQLLNDIEKMLPQNQYCMAESLLGKKVKVNYDFPLNNEIFEITGERKDSVEVTGDFSAGTNNVSQSEWIAKDKIKQFV